MKSLPLWLYLSNLILTGKFYCLNFFLLKNSDDRIFLSHQHYLLYNLYFNPELVKIPNDIKKIIENKKKLSNIEQKVGETWQGKVITNDTNLNILTWEKVDE